MRQDHIATSSPASCWQSSVQKQYRSFYLKKKKKKAPVISVFSADSWTRQLQHYLNNQTWDLLLAWTSLQENSLAVSICWRPASNVIALLLQVMHCMRKNNTRRVVLAQLPLRTTFCENLREVAE